VAGALSELLCGCLGAAGGLHDAATFAFVGDAAEALGRGGAYAPAAVVCAQASQSWAREAAAAEARAAAAAGAGATPAAAALSSLGSLLGRCCTAAVFRAGPTAATATATTTTATTTTATAASATADGGFDEAAGCLVSAAVFLAHGGGPFLMRLPPSASSEVLSALGACLAAAAPRPEPSLCGAALALLAALEKAPNAALAGRLLSTPLDGAGTVGAAVASGLAHQLCGHCPQDRVGGAGASLHWLLVASGGEQGGGGPHKLPAAAAGAFAAAAAAKGVDLGVGVRADGRTLGVGGEAVVARLLSEPLDGWLQTAQALWTRMR
jgi:hypothetical protein